DGAAVTPAAQDAPWYTDGVKWVADQKLADSAAPDSTVSREALVLLCYRYATMKGISYGQTGPKISSFADAASVSANSADAMAWAVGAGIINGKDGNKLDPAGSVTRAELSTIFMRLVSYRV
ncbi:MAG: S-layer homology domain-containing protein, partial [Pseudoflavonifractor sp.]